MRHAAGLLGQLRMVSLTLAPQNDKAPSLETGWALCRFGGEREIRCQSLNKRFATFATASKIGGEGEIRTLEGFSDPTRFRDEHVQPLRHLPMMTGVIIRWSAHPRKWAMAAQGGCNVLGAAPRPRFWFSNKQISCRPFPLTPCPSPIGHIFTHISAGVEGATIGGALAVGGTGNNAKGSAS